MEKYLKFILLINILISNLIRIKEMNILFHGKAFNIYYVIINLIEQTIILNTLKKLNNTNQLISSAREARNCAPAPVAFTN